MVDVNDKAGFRKRVTRSFVYNGVGNVISKVTYLVALLITLREISAADLGVAQLVLTTIVILRSVTEMSLGVALIQVKELRERDIHSLFWFSLIVAAAFYGLVYVGGAPALGWFYEQDELVGLLRAHALTILVFAFVFVPRTMMERDLQFGRIAIIDNVMLLVASGVMIWLAVEGHGPWAFVWSDVVFRVGQAVLSQLVRPYWPKLYCRPAEVWHMVRFGMYASGSRLLYNVYINADYLIVGKLFSEHTLGIYAFAYRVVAEPVKTLATIVNQVSYPAFARLQHELDQLRTYFCRIAEMSLGLIGVLLVAIVAFLDQVLLGFGFEKYQDSIALVYVFAVVGTVQAVAPLVPQLLNAVGRPRQNFLYSLACCIILPTAFAIGATHSITGVAVAWMVGYPIVAMLLFWFGANALEFSFGTMMVRSMAGLAVVIPLGIFAFGLRLLFTEVLELSAQVSAIAGVLVILATGGLVGWRRARAALSPPPTAKEPDEAPQ